jgi:hypothetical protein
MRDAKSSWPSTQRSASRDAIVGDGSTARLHVVEAAAARCLSHGPRRSGVTA